jgi:glycosyltransferase involved in cell wall biosynthesis
MRILFVVPYVPNLIRVRPFNFIRFLAERGNEVVVFTLWSDEQERASLDQIRQYTSEVLALRLPRWRSTMNSLLAVPTRRPLQSVYCWQPELAHELDRCILHTLEDGVREFQAIHVEHLRGANYGLHIKSTLSKYSNTSVPVVWDSVDSISLLFRQAATSSKSLFSRLITRFELGRTERYESRLIRQFERVLVTSPKDQSALLSLPYPEKQPAQVSVLPNGVDLDYFKPGDERQRDSATIILSGKMSYHANVTMVMHFAQQIMPLVWASRPDARLMVVGKDPTAEIKALDSNPNIQVTGTVEHLPPYLQRATIAAAPVPYGVGIQNKVLEAMACATPVITMPQAVSALDVEVGRDVLVAQDPESFARVILELLGDAQRRQRIGAAGRSFVERAHDWRGIAARLEAIYAELSGDYHR